MLETITSFYIYTHKDIDLFHLKYFYYSLFGSKEELNFNIKFKYIVKVQHFIYFHTEQVH